MFGAFMTGAASEAQMAGFLVGLRAKGVHPVEVAGGVRALRKAMVHDQFENTVTMRFIRMTINSGLPDRLFTFVPPPGVATVPLR